MIKLEFSEAEVGLLNYERCHIFNHGLAAMPHNQQDRPAKQALALPPALNTKYF